MENGIATIYPRTVVLSDSKLARLLKEKADLILEGRKTSEDIEAKEAEMEVIDKEVQEIEATVDLTDLKLEAEKLTPEFNAIMDKMEENQKKVRKRLNEIVPQEMKDKYDNTKKGKEELENKRNKIGLRVQKWNDKIIPLGRKIMAPLLKSEFEDYDTLRIENENVVGTIFNHLEDWKKAFFAKKK